MHYRNKKTGEIISVKSVISAPNYELIEGAEAPKKEADEAEKAPRKYTKRKKQ